MATFRVAGASEYLAITGWGIDGVKLAKKAWVWLGQRCTTIDAVPASYELEARGTTAENFPVVLRAVCTVGPTTEYEVDPLLLRPNSCKLLPAPRRGNKELVEGVVEARVRALAAGMTAEQISAKGGAAGFATLALESAQLELGKYGLRVYSATVERLAVHVPAPANNKVRIVAAPAAMGLSVQVGHGATVSWSSMTVATKKAGSCDKMAGVGGVEAHWEDNVAMDKATEMMRMGFSTKTSGDLYRNMFATASIDLHLLV